MKFLLHLKQKSVVKAILVDPELKLPQVVRDATISPGFNSNRCKLSLTNSVDGKESRYSGKTTKSKASALIYDHSKGSFTLEQIDTQFTFDSKSNSPVEGSEASILAALIEEAGEPEADNPFDWRHQLRRERTPSPDSDQFQLDTGTTTSTNPSPAIKPVKARPRQASSPPGMSIEFEDEGQPTPDPELISQQEDHNIGDDEEEEEDEEDSDAGGLQISWDGASKPTGFRGRFSARKPDGPPTSLRSAANSQSPAVRQQARSVYESDGDVDEMQLSNHSLSQEAAVGFLAADSPAGASVVLSSDDMEAEIGRAMLEVEEEEAEAEALANTPPPPPVAQSYVVVDDESSSESEEE